MGTKIDETQQQGKYFMSFKKLLSILYFSRSLASAASSNENYEEIKDLLLSKDEPCPPLSDDERKYKLWMYKSKVEKTECENGLEEQDKNGLEKEDKKGKPKYRYGLEKVEGYLDEYCVIYRLKGKVLENLTKSYRVRDENLEKLRNSGIFEHESVLSIRRIFRNSEKCIHIVVTERPDMTLEEFFDKYDARELLCLDYTNFSCPTDIFQSWMRQLFRVCCAMEEKGILFTPTISNTWVIMDGEEGFPRLKFTVFLDYRLVPQDNRCKNARGLALVQVMKFLRDMCKILDIKLSDLEFLFKIAKKRQAWWDDLDDLYANPIVFSPIREQDLPSNEIEVLVRNGIIKGYNIAANPVNEEPKLRVNLIEFLNRTKSHHTDVARDKLVKYWESDFRLLPAYAAKKWNMPQIWTRASMEAKYRFWSTRHWKGEWEKEFVRKDAKKSVFEKKMSSGLKECDSDPESLEQVIISADKITFLLSEKRGKAIDSMRDMKHKDTVFISRVKYDVKTDRFVVVATRPSSIVPFGQFLEEYDVKRMLHLEFGECSGISMILQEWMRQSFRVCYALGKRGFLFCPTRENTWVVKEGEEGFPKLQFVPFVDYVEQHDTIVEDPFLYGVTKFFLELCEELEIDLPSIKFLHEGAIKRDPWWETMDDLLSNSVFWDHLTSFAMWEYCLRHKMQPKKDNGLSTVRQDLPLLAIKLDNNFNYLDYTDGSPPLMARNGSDQKYILKGHIERGGGYTSPHYLLEESRNMVVSHNEIELDAVVKEWISNQNLLPAYMSYKFLLNERVYHAFLKSNYKVWFLRERMISNLKSQLAVEIQTGGDLRLTALAQKRNFITRLKKQLLACRIVMGLQPTNLSPIFGTPSRVVPLKILRYIRR